MKPVRVLVMLGMALVVAGCARPANPESTSTVLAGPIAAAATSVTPSLLPTAALSIPPPTAAMILVTAVKGNVFIRRGPDLAFDPVAVLMGGQSAPVLARDVLGKWVQIPIPGQGQRAGWVSAQTRFIALSGDIMRLPEVTPAEWPVLASVRNCTQHQMEADPGGIPVPAVTDFPDNDVPINPGVYTIHDTAVEGSPEVLQVELREGTQIDIRTDGDGNRKKCPLP